MPQALKESMAPSERARISRSEILRAVLRTLRKGKSNSSAINGTSARGAPPKGEPGRWFKVVLAGTETVRTALADDEPGVSVACEKVPVAPEGRPVTVSVIGLLKVPSTGATVMTKSVE